MDFDDYQPTKADDRALRKELHSRDYDHAACFIRGYVGMPLDDARAQDWDMVAAWQSGQDWAIRDYHTRTPPTSLKRQLWWWIKQKIRQTG